MDLWEEVFLTMNQLTNRTMMQYLKEVKIRIKEVDAVRLIKIKI